MLTRAIKNDLLNTSERVVLISQFPTTLVILFKRTLREELYYNSTTPGLALTIYMYLSVQMSCPYGHYFKQTICGPEQAEHLGPTDGNRHLEWDNIGTQYSTHHDVRWKFGNCVSCCRATTSLLENISQNTHCLLHHFLHDFDNSGPYHAQLLGKQVSNIIWQWLH